MFSLPPPPPPCRHITAFLANGKFPSRPTNELPSRSESRKRPAVSRNLLFMSESPEKYLVAKKYLAWALTVEGVISLITSIVQGARSVVEYFWDGVLFLGAMSIAGIVPAIIVVFIVHRFYNDEHAWLALAALALFGAIFGIPMGIKGLDNPGDGNGFRMMGIMVLLVTLLVLFTAFAKPKPKPESPAPKEPE